MSNGYKRNKSCFQTSQISKLRSQASRDPESLLTKYWHLVEFKQGTSQVRTEDEDAVCPREENWKFVTLENEECGPPQVLGNHSQDVGLYIPQVRPWERGPKEARRNNEELLRTDEEEEILDF